MLGVFLPGRQTRNPVVRTAVVVMVARNQSYDYHRPRQEEDEEDFRHHEAAASFVPAPPPQRRRRHPPPRGHALGRTRNSNGVPAAPTTSGTTMNLPRDDHDILITNPLSAVAMAAVTVVVVPAVPTPSAFRLGTRTTHRRHVRGSCTDVVVVDALDLLIPENPRPPHPQDPAASASD
jgi:hypothetical protein